MEQNQIKETPLSKGQGVKEIAEGVNAELMQPVFLDTDVLIQPKVKLSQINARGHRYYYFVDEDGESHFMPSVTTVLGITMPENKFLTEWKLNMGKDKAAEYTADRAAYGTFMHACIEQLVVNRTYNLDMLVPELLRYIRRERLDDSFINHANELKKDILAFAAFMYDYDVQPLAVEIALYHPELIYAGMIDLVANIRELPRSEEDKALAKIDEKRAKAGEDKKKLAKVEEEYEAVKEKYSGRLNAIIDFKSGRKAFYEEHELQLGMYEAMWNETFPEAQVTGLFNWSPKDWRKAPAYNFKDQTESPNIAKIPMLLELYKFEVDEDREVTTFGGIIDLSRPASIMECVNTEGLAELMARRWNKSEEEQSEEAQQQEKSDSEETHFDPYGVQN